MSAVLCFIEKCHPLHQGQLFPFWKASAWKDASLAMPERDKLFVLHALYVICHMDNKQSQKKSDKWLYL